MKRFFLLTVILMAGVVAQAAPKAPLNLEDFLVRQKALAERQGREFKEDAAKRNFEKKDLDKDGILSVEEQAPKKEKAE